MIVYPCIADESQISINLSHNLGQAVLSGLQKCKHCKGKINIKHKYRPSTVFTSTRVVTQTFEF